MREQVITPRSSSGGRGSNSSSSSSSSSSGVVASGRERAGGGAPPPQRPAPRRAKPSAASQKRAAATTAGWWGTALRYFPRVAKIVLAVGAGVLIFKGYGAVASASFFQVKSIEVEGAARIPADDVKAAVRRAAGASGVWRADLTTIANEIKELKWVRAATVARVLPSGFRVRITEREPRLVARNSAGTFEWVDEEGVILGKASVADLNSSFFIRGLDETTSEAARQQNRERIRKALEMEREWKASGLIDRVSEVNLDQLRDVRAQLSGDYAQIQVFLGERDFGRRLARAFKALAEVPAPSPRGPVTYLDATREKGVTVGFSSGNQSPTESVGLAGASAFAGTPRAEAKKAEHVAAARSTHEKRRQTHADEPHKGHAKAPAAAVVAALRPRRVGR